MTEHTIAAGGSPDWDDAEVRRRLGRAYAIILSYRPKERRTADGGELGDQTRTAPSRTPVIETENHEPA